MNTICYFTEETGQEKKDATEEEGGGGQQEGGDGEDDDDLDETASVKEQRNIVEEIRKAELEREKTGKSAQLFIVVMSGYKYEPFFLT